MNFKQLSDVLRRTSDELVRRSVRAVNVNLTIRNWLFGYYIVEYEQNGEDRATYGKRLMQNLAEDIGIKGLTAPELSRCRQFYLAYPEILGTLSQIFSFLPNSLIIDNKDPRLLEFPIFGSATQELERSEVDHFINIIQSISYTHFTELIKIEDPVKRRFYEMLVLRTQLSVKELKREIYTLTYERLGASSDKGKAWISIQDKFEPVSGHDLVKSHYFFEFLNIRNPELIEESALERALIGHLQEFIMELGNGFCFEARQKRILIGDEYFFPFPVCRLPEPWIPGLPRSGSDIVERWAEPASVPCRG